jgi:hypothetical protein
MDATESLSLLRRGAKGMVEKKPRSRVPKETFS